MRVTGGYRPLFQNKQNNVADEMQMFLGKLFDDEEKVMLLAKNFRIFPTLFNRNFLEKMLNSEDMQEYIEYLEDRQSRRQARKKYPLELTLLLIKL